MPIFLYQKRLVQKRFEISASANLFFFIDYSLLHSSVVQKVGKVILCPFVHF